MSKISSTTFATKISDLKLSTAARLMCVSHSTNVSISSSINKTQIILSHSSPVSSFSTDDKILVASTFNNIKVWDLYSTKVIRTIQNQSADLLYFHPFADCFVSTTSTTIKIWDLRKSSPIQSYNIKQSNCVSITPDGRWLAAGLQSGIVDVWDITAGKRVFNVDGDQPVSNVMFSPKDLFMVKVHTDNRLDVIDLDDFKITCSDVVQGGKINASVFHPNGDSLLFSLDDSLQIWNFSESINCRDVISVPWNDVRSLQVDKDKLFAGSVDGNFALLWAVDLNKTVKVIESKIQEISIENPLPKIKSIDSITEAVNEKVMKKTSSQTSLPNLKPASSTDSIKSTTSLKTSKQSEKQPLDKQLSLPTIQPLKKKRDKKQNDIQNTDTEQQISEVIKSTHERIKGNLKSRLKYLQMIKQDWDTGIEGNRGITQAIQTMAKINDCSVWKDVLKIVNTTPKLVSDLDTCLVLLPVLRDLLFEGKDSGIVIAAETIRALLKMFSSVILENLNTLKRNVDLVAEEREKKCRACFDGFFEIKGMLYELRGPGRVGAAVDECMRDLAVFSV